MSKLPTFEVRTSASSADTELVPVFQDSSKKAGPIKGKYASVVQKFRKGDVFEAKLGSVQFVRFGGKGKSQNALYLGLGPIADLTAEKARIAGGNAWAKLVAEKSKSLTLDLASLGGLSIARPLAEGLVFNAYQWKKYRTDSNSTSAASVAPTKIIVVVKDAATKKALTQDLAQVTAAAEAMSFTRDWSNEPPNFGTPEFFAEESKRLSKTYGLKCTVLDEKAAAKEKMNLFLAVGQGSVRENRVVVLEYNPPAKSGVTPKTVALVGKGVTFDTGGISIKPSGKMEEMKHDMTGAATVFGAVILASLWKAPTRVVAILGFSENMPDGGAIVPGTVITARNGKTVEINNTDAEGRLVLADMLDYAHDFKPDAIVDIATLTGAIGVCLGKLHAGLFSNNEFFAALVTGSAGKNGEKVWELPVTDDYFDDLKGETADIRNVGSEGLGGSSRGAVFLKQFIKPKMPWVHLDIAYVGANVGHLSYIPKRGATGLFVRTLAQIAMDL